jgi:hypothetical protein
MIIALRVYHQFSKQKAAAAAHTAAANCKAH